MQFLNSCKNSSIYISFIRLYIAEDYYQCGVFVRLGAFLLQSVRVFVRVLCARLPVADAVSHMLSGGAVD